MFPDNVTYIRQRVPVMQRQRGSLLVIALFIIIVFALLGAVMTRMLAASAENTVTEVYGLRALTAAQSGLQAKIAAAFPIGAGEVCEESALTFNFNNNPGLENCQVTATCVKDQFPADNIDYYRFESIGTCVAGDIVTSRTVKVDAKVEP